MAKRGPREGGVAEYFGIDGDYRVVETFTCCHCNYPRELPGPNAPAIGFCRKCMRRECLSCAKKLNGRCAAFEKQVDEYEKLQAGRAADVRMLQTVGVFPG
jgi:hypothetical protein